MFKKIYKSILGVFFICLFLYAIIYTDMVIQGFMALFAGVSYFISAFKKPKDTVNKE